MPFCPKCRYEYRPGIKVCPDCDLPLKDNLPPEEPEPKAEYANLVCVATFPYDLPAQEARLRLESHGIRAVMANEIMSQTDIVLAWADGGVKVLVAEEDAAKAAKILESD